MHHLWGVEVDCVQLTVSYLQHPQGEELAVGAMETVGYVVKVDGVVLLQQNLWVGAGEWLGHGQLTVDLRQGVVGEVEVGECAWEAARDGHAGQLVVREVQALELGGQTGQVLRNLRDEIV